MNIKKHLALLMALALAVVPVSALADDLFYDDGTFEISTALDLAVAPAVEFAAPPAPGVYALDTVSFALEATAPGTYPVTVQIWDDALDVVETIAWDVEVAVPESTLYTLDLTAAKLSFTSSVSVGIFMRDDGIVPIPADPLNLSVDTDAPAGFSYVYDSTVVPPLDPWTLDAASNYGIRAAVRLVPAMTCQGFLPPFNRTLTLKKGGRTIPLKAFLFDDAGAPATKSLLTAPPLVQLLYAEEAGAEPIDVTAFVAPAGRSNKGQAFRGTREGKWMFNLKTKKFLPPGTYTVLVSSGDGTGYVVDPACTGTFVIVAPKTKKTHPTKGPK